MVGSFQNDDSRVVDKPIGDGRGYSGAVEDFSPIGKRKVRCDDRRFFFVPGADDLEEEVGTFIAQRKISYLVDDQDVRRLIEMEFFQQRAVCLGGDEVIDHIHGGCKQGADPGLGGGVGDAFCQEAFARAGIPDEDDVFFLRDEVQIHQVQYAGFLFGSRYVEVEVELVDGLFFKEF